MLISVQVVVGGAAGLVYSPESITAAVGDMVIFTFMNANHTVTQSAFTSPCVKLEGGMDSGFMANANNSVVPAPQMAMQVTVATPICKTPPDLVFEYYLTIQGSTASKRVTAVREWLSPLTQLPTSPKRCSSKWPSLRTELAQPQSSSEVKHPPPQQQQLLLPLTPPPHQHQSNHPLLEPWLEVLEPTQLVALALAHVSAVLPLFPTLLSKVSELSVACLVRSHLKTFKSPNSNNQTGAMPMSALEA